MSCQYVLWFEELGAGDVARVGGKNASLGEMIRTLAGEGIKTNECAELIGGWAFEPHEENPMIGWRGASRYYDPRYCEGFALGCRALRKVREEIGLRNVVPMIPFCRTPEEADRVLAEMAANGLERGKDGLEVYMMCEIPSNVLLARRIRRPVRRFLDWQQRPDPAHLGDRPRLA